MTSSTYKQHPIHETVRNIINLQDNQELHKPDVDANEQARYARDKIFTAANLVSSHLNSATEVLVSFQGLQQLNGVLQNVLTEISNYISNKNVGHLNNAANHVDQQVIPQLWTFALSTLDSIKPTDSALVQTVSRNLEESSKQFVQERDAVKSSLANLTKKTAELENKATEMTTVIATQKAEAMSVTTVVQAEYSKGEAERKELFSKSIEQFTKEFGDYKTSTKDRADEFISQLSTKRDEAANIVQVVGNIGVTGNYQNIANKENDAANFWRWATVCFFAVGVAIAVATFVEFWKEPVSTQNFWSIGIRLLYAIAITAPAWYTAKESARHRTNSDRAKQTELELASLGPFIELMPKEKKDAIREELTKKYFGNHTEAHQSDPPIKFGDIKDIVVEAIKAVKK
ncbi:hypothetical protein [Ralstonia thomasii]